MRTQVRIYYPFNVDISWITQEVVEDYAGAKISGGEAPAYCIAKWSNGDSTRDNLLPQILDTNPDFIALQDELVDEFGIERFVGKPKPREYHVRRLEIAIDNARLPADKAKLYAELREYQGWSTKPTERVGGPVINNPTGGTFIFDNSNPIEAERVVMSIFASPNVDTI